MARETAKGVFVPKNPTKYVGKDREITYRSSWEITMMMWLDKHPYVLAWASESVTIPYFNPIKPNAKGVPGVWASYVPDFFLIYADGSGSGTKHCEIVEVKPLNEVPGYQNPINERTGKQAKLSDRSQAAQIVNAAKFKAAEVYCRQRGWRFRVITERDLYNYK